MIQIQGDFFTGGCYRGLVGFAAPRLMSFPDWDLLSVLTPAVTLYYLGVCVTGERGGGGGGGFLDISTAECVYETFTLHSHKGQVRKAYS